MENRGIWTDLIGGVGLDIAEVFNQATEEYTPGINKLLIVTTGAGAQRNYTGKTGSGRLVLRDDGDNIANTRRYKTFTTKVIYNNYSQAIEVTSNTIEDREFESALDETADVAIAANFSQDEAGLQLFNGGFATTVNVNGYNMNWYGDGQPWFSTIHSTTVPGASTQSNASATGIAFGDNNLETGRIAMTLQQTDDGLPLSLLGKITLVIPVILEKEAQQVTQSTLVSEDANNAINIYTGIVNMVSTQFLDSTNNGSNTAWFLEVPGRAKAYHEVRAAARMDQQVNILNKVVTFTVDARWANYIKDWRRAWATKGDLASYSS